jgi:N-acyl-D-aspartate/D-glutamate deacylase
LVIRGATIVDGTGATRRRGDVAIAGTKIAAIGSDLGAARETLDADGMVLMPGIIDGHTHYDAQLTWDSAADPSVELGVTTVVIGNCGFTIAPCRPGDRDVTMRNLTQVEGMSLAALRAGIRWDFESMPQYLDMLERGGLVPNVAALAGHSSIRTYVMGADAAKRPANDAEIAAMARLVRESIEAGAIGLGSSTNEPHNGEGGVPMPSRLADRREFAALIGAMGRGVFMLTKGGTTSIESLESLAAETGRPIIVAALLHNHTRPEKTFDDLNNIVAARRRGRMLTPQVSCCPLTMEFKLSSAYLFEDRPAWQRTMRTPAAELPALLRDASFRAAVREDFDGSIGKRLFNGEWQRLFVREVRDPAHARVEGRSIADLAKSEDKHPVDWMLDFGLEENLETLFIAELLNIDEQAVGRLIAEESSHVSLSDAGAHLTFFNDADFGLHLLGHWVREKSVLTLEQGVHKLTRQPAELFGLTGRGTIAPGAAADLLLVDPATVGRGERKRVHDLPAGASRLRASPRGVHGVWINGVKVADASGRVAREARPGKLLRHYNA